LPEASLQLLVPGGAVRLAGQVKESFTREISRWGGQDLGPYKNLIWVCVLANGELHATQKKINDHRRGFAVGTLRWRASVDVLVASGPLLAGIADELIDAFEYAGIKLLVASQPKKSRGKKSRLTD